MKEGSAHPPGAIILALGEFLRYGAAVRSLMRLNHPPGSWFLMKQSVAVVPNLNECIREALERDAMWVHIQSDDHVYPETLLLDLLATELDVVVPFILMRSPPFRPVVFKDYVEGEGYMPYHWSELPETGTMPVFAAGTGGMLIRRNVLEDLGDPWFKYGEGEHLNEDLLLCKRIRELGHEIHLSVDAQMGHCGTFVAAPTRTEDERWDVRIGLGPPTSGKTNTVVLRTEEVRDE